jgi:hypothetical protein
MASVMTDSCPNATVAVSARSKVKKRRMFTNPDRRSSGLESLVLCTPDYQRFAGQPNGRKKTEVLAVYAVIILKPAVSECDRNLPG